MNRSEELELQYSPSRWSKRYSADEIIQKHVDVTSKASNEAKSNIPCQLDVSYGPLEREKMDIFGTTLPSDSPILIFIHGGYWQELSRELSAFMVEPLNKHNFKVIVLGYTLCPQATLPKIVDEIQNAFLKCIEYAKTNNSRRLYICGHSAGAHLTASLFETFFNSIPSTDQQLLKGVFLISGVYDLIPLIETYVNDALKLDNIAAKKLSPLYQNLDLKNNILRNIPFFVIVGENDSPAFIEQSQAFYKKLKDLGYNTQLNIVDQVDHFDIVEQLNDENYEIIKLMLRTDQENCISHD